MQSKTEAILYTLQNTNHQLNWQHLLVTVIDALECTTGTLHTFDSENKLLELKAQQGIPDFLLPKMALIPVGKGMAGIAAARKQPVEMCNLQTDDSGVARPAAKDTKVEGSIAVPMLLNEKLYGTLGVAKPVPYDFTETEKADLMKIGEQISRYIQSQSTEVM